MTVLTSRVTDIDIAVEIVARSISAGQKIDRELAAGLGCSASMASIQREIDQASAACESLDRDLRRWKAARK